MKKNLLMGLLASVFIIPNSHAITKDFNEQTISSNNFNKVGYLASVNSEQNFNADDDFNINLFGGNVVKTDFIGFGIVNSESATSINNLTLNLNANEGQNSSTYADDVIGLWRSEYNSDKKHAANVTENITINMHDGVIADDLFATRDDAAYLGGQNYRAANTINLHGGTVTHTVNGGAGANENIINIYSDANVAGKDSAGIITVGDNEANKDLSINGEVNLIDMNETSPFLSSFVEEGDHKHGIIYGSNVSGTSTLNFINADKAKYAGGFKDWDNVNIDENSSQLILAGVTYEADTWNINGTLNPSGKILNTATEDTLNLNVGKKGGVWSSFISKNNINATNEGLLSGVYIGDKTATINNSGIFTGKTQAGNFALTNTGQINSGYYKLTSIDMTTNNIATIENSGSIVNELNLNGNFNINNTGTLNQLTLSGDGNVELYNKGIALGDEFAISAMSNTLNGTIYNSGSVGSTINASNFNVKNINGGSIEGSIIANSYNQDANSTWVATYSKEDGLSSITADNITFADNATIDLVTNNVTKNYDSGDEVKLFNSSSDLSNTIGDVNIEHNSIFNNYDLLVNGNDGYLVVSSVDPTSFSSTADSTNSNHNTIIQSSHRISEMFLEKDSANVVNLSSGDDYSASVNTLNFMPMAGYAHQDGDEDSSGYENKYYGGILYMEHKFKTNFTAGLGFGYLHNNNDYEDNYGSDSEINSYRPFAFINYDYNKFDFDFTLGYAFHKVDNNRIYENGGDIYSASADYNVNEYYTHFNIGYKAYENNNMTITPTAGLYYSYVEDDSYEETGDGPLNMNVATSEYNSLKSSLGIAVKKTYALDSGSNITPELKLKWYHELGDSNSGVDSYFLGQGVLFSTDGIESPKDLGDVSLKVSINSNELLDVYAEGFYQFGDKYYNLGGGVGVKVKF